MDYRRIVHDSLREISKILNYNITEINTLYKVFFSQYKCLSKTKYVVCIRSNGKNPFKILNH